MPEPDVVLCLGEKRYPVSLRYDFTGADSQRLFDTIGMDLSEAFARLHDPRVLAGLIWLRVVKTKRKTTYADVADEVTFADVEATIEASDALDATTDDDEGEGGEANPEG